MMKRWSSWKHLLFPNGLKSAPSVSRRVTRSKNVLETTARAADNKATRCDIDATVSLNYTWGREGVNQIGT